VYSVDLDRDFYASGYRNHGFSAIETESARTALQYTFGNAYQVIVESDCLGCIRGLDKVMNRLL